MKLVCLTSTMMQHCSFSSFLKKRNLAFSFGLPQERGTSVGALTKLGPNTNNWRLGPPRESDASASTCARGPPSRQQRETRTPTRTPRRLWRSWPSGRGRRRAAALERLPQGQCSTGASESQIRQGDLLLAAAGKKQRRPARCGLFQTWEEAARGVIVR